MFAQREMRKTFNPEHLTGPIIRDGKVIEPTVEIVMQESHEDIFWNQHLEKNEFTNQVSIEQLKKDFV